MYEVQMHQAETFSRSFQAPFELTRPLSSLKIGFMTTITEEEKLDWEMEPCTEWEEAFVQLVVASGSWRWAFKQLGGLEHATDHDAKIIYQFPNVQARIKELYNNFEQTRYTTRVTVDRLLKRAYDYADADRNVQAMVSSARALAMLHGLNAATKIEVQNMSDEEKQFETKYMQELQAALARGEEFPALPGTVPEDNPKVVNPG